MCSGREFHVWAAATGKARLQTVASLTGGTTRRLVPAERRALRPGTSTVEVSGPRCRGALPWRTLYDAVCLRKTLQVCSNINTHNGFLKISRDVKSTASAGISFHSFITHSLKKFDLTRESVDFLYNLYPLPLVPPRGFH